MAAQQRNLTSQILLEAGAQLEALGFRKRAGSIFVRPSDNDSVLGWLGLNRAVNSRDRSVELNPVIGLRDQRIERLVAELHDSKPHPYVPATVSSSIGYLMPSRAYKCWRVANDQQVGEKLSDLAADVQQYGVPFLERFADTLEIVSLLASNTFTPGKEHRVERLIAAHIIAGERSQAEHHVQALLKDLNAREDPAAVHLRGFAARARMVLDERRDCRDG